jgi:hypothetical protein
MEMIPGAVVTGVHRIKQHPRRTDKFFFSGATSVELQSFFDRPLGFPNTPSRA